MKALSVVAVVLVGGAGALALGSGPVGGGRTGAGAAPATLPVATAAQRLATFAGGCFWSMQKAFDGVKGVITVTAGYAGGFKVNPTYEEVGSGSTGHAESVQVVFDPATISYEQLLDIYWHHIDPLTLNRAFCDEGEEYRSVIFVHDSTQRRIALASKERLDRSGRFATPIVTTIEPVTPFYPAEEYHQRFYRKNPMRYESYRIGCRRDQRLRQLWGDELATTGATR